MGASATTATVDELVARARAAGVELWVEGSRLKFRAAPGALVEELKRELAASRSALVDALRREAGGRAVTGDAESYRYLVESIRRFPSRDAFAGMIREAGLARVEATPQRGDAKVERARQSQHPCQRRRRVEEGHLVQAVRHQRKHRGKREEEGMQRKAAIGCKPTGAPAFACSFVHRSTAFGKAVEVRTAQQFRAARNHTASERFKRMLQNCDSSGSRIPLE